MSNDKRRAVLLAVRFVNAVEYIEERAAEAYAIDSAFDGGEFSGPAIERAMLAEQDACARRLGFTSAAVAYSVARLMLRTR